MRSVKIRNNDDLEVLANPDMEVEAMKRWTKELFLGDGTEKFMIPDELLEFGLNLMQEHFRAAKSRDVRHMILRKVLHTREVVMAGQEIMAQQTDVDWNPWMVGAVTFAHDFGRFPQALLGSFSDIKTRFDHAEEGAKILQSCPWPKMAQLGIDDKVLAEAVKNHSRLDYSVGELYGKFIRDADKLGLLSYFHYHIQEFKLPEGKVTTGALRAFLEGRLVPKKEMKTQIDVFLCWYSWQFDLNYFATKKLMETNGAEGFILDQIKKRDEEVWRQVVNQNPHGRGK